MQTFIIKYIEKQKTAFLQDKPQISKPLTPNMLKFKRRIRGTTTDLIKFNDKCESNSWVEENATLKYENVRNRRLQNNYEIIDLDKPNPNFNYK